MASRNDVRTNANLITDNTFEHRNATVMGWGYTKDGGNGSSPDLLHQVQIPIMTNEMCKTNSKYSKGVLAHITILSTMLCAGNRKGIARDACSVINKIILPNNKLKIE